MSRIDGNAKRTVGTRLLQVRTIGLVWSLACLMAASAVAADWPQWRGPNRDAVSGETGLLQQWPDDGPPLLWQATDLGDGYSTPSVVGNRVYLLANKDLDNENVLALDTSSGEVIWSTRIGKVGNPEQQPNYPAARSTPTVVGDLIYALGSDGDLTCLKRESGEVVWSENVREKFGGQPGDWAYSESPLVDDQRVVIAPGGETATVVAVDRQTGEVVWKSEVPGGDAAGYASAIVVETNGTRQYVLFLGGGLVGLDAATGQFLWRYEATSGVANMPTPIARGDLVYSGTGRTGGGLVRITSKDTATDAEQVYFDPKLPNAIGGSVLVGNYLYGAAGQVLTCADFATGEIKWADRSIAPGSFVYAEQRLFFLGENGDVALVAATPEEYRELGRFTPPNQPDLGRAKAWAYPVLANGRLYIRQASSVWCFDVTR